MSRRLRKPSWARTLQRGLAAMTRLATRSGTRALRQTLRKTLQPATAARAGRPVPGAWLTGVVMGAAGARRFRLYRPPGIALGERLPLLVMLHGCGQDANGFAASTRMNRIALRERFLVLYPEQDRLANGQGCWNWFDTRNGRAWGEAALILQAIDQVCLLHPADRDRVALAGLSAGASMAALLATRYPGRFKALAMHSGVPPGAAHSGASALRAMRGHRPATAPLVTSTDTPPEMSADALAIEWPPLLLIHGDADAVVAPSNSQHAAQIWSQAAGARAGAVRTVRRGQRYPMEVTEFKRRGSIVVTLVAVDRLGHAWSGGAAAQPFSDGRGPDASRMVWAFAARQFRA